MDSVLNPFSSCTAISRDERYYDEPEAFCPERHLNEDGRLMADDRELPHSYVFGFGRRWDEMSLATDLTLNVHLCKGFARDKHSQMPHYGSLSLK